LQQPVPMPVLFLAHLPEFFGLLRIGFLQAGGKIFENARVLFLQRNRQSQNLLLREALKCFHRLPDTIQTAGENRGSRDTRGGRSAVVRKNEYGTRLSIGAAVAVELADRMKIPLCGAALALICGVVVGSAQDVRISEFMANNDRTLAAPDGAFTDWIEIQNARSVAVKLAAC